VKDRAPRSEHPIGNPDAENLIVTAGLFLYEQLFIPIFIAVLQLSVYPEITAV
jgi:hypothetical protein